MNILYVTDYRKIAQAGRFINEYLNDLLFYGFHELFGVRVVDSTPIVHLYDTYLKEIPRNHLWGKGFTSTGLIANDEVNRSCLIEKIKDQFFDLIVYGSVHRCLDYYDLVKESYSPERIILIDGEDHVHFHQLAGRHPYFKRELIYQGLKNVHPISFCFPAFKLMTSSKSKKTKILATVIPGKADTYIFEKEELYYADYKKSLFGITQKKAGWDCMRHYEIIGNLCFPYFIDLKECPVTTLTHLPKALILEGMSLLKINKRGGLTFEKSQEANFRSLLADLYAHFLMRCTTKAMAQYVLSKVL